MPICHVCLEEKDEITQRICCSGALCRPCFENVLEQPDTRCPTCRSEMSYASLIGPDILPSPGFRSARHQRSVVRPHPYREHQERRSRRELEFTDVIDLSDEDAPASVPAPAPYEPEERSAVSVALEEVSALLVEVTEAFASSRNAERILVQPPEEMQQIPRVDREAAFSRLLDVRVERALMLMGRASRAAHSLAEASAAEKLAVDIARQQA